MSVESSKKRLLTPNYKPKQSPNNQPGSCPNPNDDQPLKKTRDLPNLSDCHGCNVRINHTNPQDRLLILDSVWRIVLLCRKCLRKVQLGQNCPYCYKECGGDDDCVKCGDCQRRIHRECVLSFGEESPWFLCNRELGVGVEGFSICVDCWVPEVFKRSSRIVRKKKVGWSCKGGNGGRSVMSDGGCSGGKEVVLALMAPNYDKGKNGAGRSFVGVANGDLGFKNGKRIGGSGKSGLICYKRQRVVKDVDGGEGAGRSPCALKESRYFPITYRTRDKKLEWRTYERGSLKRKVFVENIKDGASAEVVGISGPCQYERGSLKRNVVIEKIKIEASAEVVGTSGPCLYERDSLKRKIFLENVEGGASDEAVGKTGPCVYERGSLKRKIFVEDIKKASAEVVGISGPCADSARNTEISLSELCNFSKLERVNESKCSNLVDCDSDASREGVSDNEKCHRYLFKYRKKHPVHKQQLSGECNMVDG